MEKVVLAYSGGLDTSFCAVWLSKERNLEVHAVMVNLGGFSPLEIKKTEERAYRLGVKTFKIIEDEKRYYEDCIRYLIYANVLKNNTYPLSVSSERVFQATAIAHYAKEIGAKYVAHGSTAAGNDQVRFDAVFRVLLPHIEVITPIRDLKLSRKEERDYLAKNQVEVDFEKSRYSINKGLWGTSIGGKETLTSNESLPESAYPTPVSKTDPELMTLGFDKGNLSSVNGKKYSHPVQAIRQVEEIAQPFGIGRDTHVGDTIIGIKGRVSFEAAAPLIIIKAHHLLEKHTLTKNQLIIKDQLSIFYGNYLHDGWALDPVMKNLESFFVSTQEKVSGEVKVELYPYHFILIGISSPHDLMSSKFGKYGEENATWTEADVKGFSKIYSNALSIYHQVHQEY
ncbi:MAG: argininosuccinate synthase [Bergeyella sp.]|nr:argininosuccinate synthase [Bergeyella sp.]